MPLNHALIGVPTEWQERSWTSTDALLYAVGVGAGLGDPLADLEFTTENTAGVQQQVLPTFGAVLAHVPIPSNLGHFDRAHAVHAEQSIEFHAPLPVEGTLRTSATVTGIHDKGTGALVEIENHAVIAATGEAALTARAGLFIRGEGGFGGSRGTASSWRRPDHAPDHSVTLTTRPEQALIYRLSGDRNPLHADPACAARGGFSRPILQGLCTYGFTGRALLNALCGSKPDRLKFMSGRFSRPVLPGDSLVVSIWRVQDGYAQFQTAKEDGTVVIDRGTCRFS